MYNDDFSMLRRNGKAACPLIKNWPHTHTSDTQVNDVHLLVDSGQWSADRTTLAWQATHWPLADQWWTLGDRTLHAAFLQTDSQRISRWRQACYWINTCPILSYEDRVQQCKLTTLETRRVRGDQIEVFKITHGIEGLDSGMFF